MFLQKIVKFFNNKTSHFFKMMEINVFTQQTGKYFENLLFHLINLIILLGLNYYFFAKVVFGIKIWQQNSKIQKK